MNTDLDNRYKSDIDLRDLISTYDISVDEYIENIFDTNDNFDIFDDNAVYDDYMLNKIKIFEDSILSDLYNSLSEAECDSIEYDLYLRLCKYLPDDFVQNFDAAFSHCKVGEAYTVVDRVLLYVLLHADSETVFNSILHDMGAYLWRVGSLTDDIYNENPNEGALLVSKDGEMRWYPEFKFMNSWEGAKGNPYYGKFQMNVNDTLLCFKEYHPELIVDAFPDDDLLRRYLLAYRRSHDEMYCYIDDDGDEIVVGDWYHNGVDSDDCIRNVGFMRVYYDWYRFTDDDCRKLLSNEIVSVCYEGHGGCFIIDLKMDVFNAASNSNCDNNDDVMVHVHEISRRPLVA